MDLKPIEIYEDYKSSRINKKKAIDLLITIIENMESNVIRKESLEFLSKIDLKHNEIFNILENILVSDSDKDLRYSAAKIIGSKFLKKSLVPFLWALKYESSYNTLITVIKSLEEISEDKFDSILINEMKKIENDKFNPNEIPLFVENDQEQLSHKDIAEILLNSITVKSLKNKFDKIKFKIEDGLVVELDFSNVDNQIINWKDREALQDPADIAGIPNLKFLKKIEFFPLKWATNNEFTYQNSIALLTSLERLNNKTAKRAIASSIKTIIDNKFNSSIKDLCESNENIENLSVSKLSDILKNYLTISIFKKKYPSIDYKAENGEIISIHVSNTSIITLPKFINNFRSLRSLTLKGCRLANLPESIGVLSYLKILDLERNNLKTLPKSVSFLSSLKMLNLKNNQVQKIPYSIGALTSLQYLNLEQNNLQYIPRSIGYLNSLKFLNIRGNSLKSIPSSIGSLKNLKVLDLRLNKLEFLPYSIGLLSSLETLNLDHNKLLNLPKSINTISSLKILSLEENSVRNIPDTIKHLKSIEILKIGWNKLENLPASIGSLNSLKYLRLNNNRLLELPESICLLSSLEFLDASGNKIQILPVNIGSLKSLRILKLSDNKLRNLPDSICSLPFVEKLNFNENEINYLPQSIGSLFSLKEIWLNGNKLKNIPESIGKLSSLKLLKLNNNDIKKLPITLNNIHSLKEISLNWKNIENFYEFDDFVEIFD